MTGKPIPVAILTGFLGSGKTSLLNRLLRHPAMHDTAVIVNEVGEIALDHLLVESALEDTIVLQSGCICCSIRGDLVDTLRELLGKRSRGEIPPFSRAVIETTGLADPGPIVRTLVLDPLVSSDYRLSRVVTTVDSILGPGQIANQPEAGKQVALADLLVLTKTDLASPEDVADLKAALSSINPLSLQCLADAAGLDPDLVMADGEMRSTPAVFNRLAMHMIPARSGVSPRAGFTEQHGFAIQAHSFLVDDPIPEAGLRLWLESILSLRSNDILRIKGLVLFSGQDKPTAIHAVQHLVHPGTRLAAWPDEDRRSRIVCITRNIPGKALRESLDRAIEAAAS